MFVVVVYVCKRVHTLGGVRRAALAVLRVSTALLCPLGVILSLRDRTRMRHLAQRDTALALAAHSRRGAPRFAAAQPSDMSYQFLGSRASPHVVQAHTSRAWDR